MHVVSLYSEIFKQHGLEASVCIEADLLTSPETPATKQSFIQLYYFLFLNDITPYINYRIM